jgi:hypothetical protein
MPERLSIRDHVRNFQQLPEQIIAYRKIMGSNTSCLEAHVGFFRLLMMGIFGRVDFLISNAH